MSTRTGLDFQDTFNTLGATTADLKSAFSVEGNQTPDVVSMGGRNAVEINLDHYTSAVANRTELVANTISGSDFTHNQAAILGNTYYYGVSMYMPSNWQSDSTMEILQQFHDTPDPGEATKNPAVSLQIRQMSDGAHFTVEVRSDTKAFTPAGGPDRYTGDKEYDLGLVNSSLGSWSDWVWKITWADNSKGDLTLWHNNQMVLDLPDQGNAFNDQQGPYFKFGDYKWDWSSNSSPTGTDSRTLYFSDVRIASGPDATYDSVAPTQSDTPTSTNGNTSVGHGTDTLVLTMAEMAYQGDAQYIVSVDGHQVGGVMTAHALHNLGQTETLTINGDWGTGAHNVDVTFINDAWSGVVGGGDRNLYLLGATYDGAGETIAKTNITMNGASSFAVTDTTDPVTGLPPETVIDTASNSYTLLDSEKNLELIGTAIMHGYGNSQDNTITGGAGGSRLWGYDGNDTLIAGGGQSMLWGGNGNDTLIGGSGTNTLNGGAGADILYGGSGFNSYVYTDPSESKVGAGNRDIIMNFNHAAGDKIDLTSIDASTAHPGNQTFTFIGTKTFDGTAGELHTITQNGHLIVEGDINGDKVADFQIEVHGVSAMTAGDFYL